MSSIVVLDKSINTVGSAKVIPVQNSGKLKNTGNNSDFVQFLTGDSSPPSPGSTNFSGARP